MDLWQKFSLLALLSSTCLFSEETYYASTIVPYCPKEKTLPKEGGGNRSSDRGNQDYFGSSSSSDRMNSYNGDNERGKSSSSSNLDKPPSGLPEPASTFYASATYEYLQLMQEGLAFAFSTSTNEDFQTTSTNVVNPKSPWRSALGLNIGGVTEPGWSIDLGYTMIYNKDNNTQTISSPAPPYTDISFLWNSFFNRIDLTLSKSCNMGRCFPFYPFIGLVAAFDSQTFKSNYIQPVEDVPQQDYWSSKQSWWAFGPYLGGEFVFFFVDSFLFLFRGGASIDLNHWSASRNVTRTPDMDSTLIPIPTFEAEVSDSYWSVRSMFDFIVSLRYQTNLSPGKPLFFQVDWRGQMWPNHLLLFNYVFDTEPVVPTIVPEASFPTPSNFSVQGIGITVGFSF